MSKIIILDCENFDSILDSLSNIFNTDKSKILSYLNDVSLDEIWEKSRKERWAYEYLFEHFKQQFKINKSIIIKAYWFHNTRVLKGADFIEGILPLEKAIIKIEEIIKKVIQNLDKSIKIDNSTHSTATIHKLNSDYDQGPWGFLIKEFAFEKVNGIHNYLNVPELVEDILRFRYPEKYDLILNEYQKTTTKCIVKFKSDRDFHPDNLKYVINYLYHKINNLEMSDKCNANISNFRKTIPNVNILEVNYYQ